MDKLRPTVPQCDQCGFSHPPIPHGEKCSMIKETTSDGTEIDFDNFFREMRNILFSQIQSKEIKNPGHFMNLVLVEVTKFSESYKEG